MVDPLKPNADGINDLILESSDPESAPADETRRGSDSRIQGFMD
jgi:hypothetical protein